MQPIQFKYGNKSANKSEEDRFDKKYDEIIKLRHILLTDHSDIAKNYTKKVLMKYFTDEEISNFSELGIHNFQNTVKMMHTIQASEISVRDFILGSI